MQIEATIRSAGYRATPQRRDFLEILAGKGSMEAEALKAAFMERGRANLTTFYRVLADLRSCGFVHALDEGGHEIFCLCEEVRNGKAPSASYELVHCHGCGKVEDRHETQISGNTLSSKKEVHVERCASCGA